MRKIINNTLTITFTEEEWLNFGYQMLLWEMIEPASVGFKETKYFTECILAQIYGDDINE
jgi:hypothetical protein